MVTPVAGWERAISRIKQGRVVVTPHINQCSTDFSSNVESGERQSNNVEPGERGKLQNNAHRPLPAGVEQNAYFILSPSLSLSHIIRCGLRCTSILPASLVSLYLLQQEPGDKIYLLPSVKGPL